MTLRKTTLLVLLLLGLSGCQTVPKQCQQTWFYMILDDGSLEVRGAIQIYAGGNTWGEPYKIIRPIDPEYQGVVDRVTALAPKFPRTKRHQITRFAPCGKVRPVRKKLGLKIT